MLARKACSAALPRLRALLGRRAALTACVLQALAATVDRADPEDTGEIASEILPYLESGEVLHAVAAASALGRLGSRLAVPPLIAALEREEHPIARAALAALREISGAALPASPSLWTHWYGEEERWWRERAPGLCSRLERAPPAGLSRADLVALLAELSEHALFRAELAPLVARALDHADAEVRELAHRALERLGARVAPADATGREEPAPRSPGPR